MSNIIANEQAWVGFVAGTLTHKFGVASQAAPKVAEVNAALDLTDFLISLTANATGNTVPTPRLKSLFETSIPGTSAAQFTADFYRDDEDDAAWDALPRGTFGTFLIKRFGGTGTDLRPVLGEEVESWPVQVTSRAGGQLSSGAAQMFTLTCAVPKEPVEDAVVAA